MTRIEQVEVDAGDAGLLVGIKVNTGAKGLAAHPGEKVTEGLDGRARRQDYFEMGARFAKWRGVIAVDGERPPTAACTSANAHALARYAALCLEAGLVPIIEPEVLMDGTHTVARGQAVTEAVLRSVFEQLVLQGVMLGALVLKPNMVIADRDAEVFVRARSVVTGPGTLGRQGSEQGRGAASPHASRTVQPGSFEGRIQRRDASAMAAALQIYFICRGETTWSVSGQHTERTHLLPTPHGEAVARALATAPHGVTCSHRQFGRALVARSEQAAGLLVQRGGTKLYVVLRRE